ncbi:hypothetical protein J6590_007326 [Homalodisca vitripennis]|nr:hypothetical protein J6590_007326 [Homalodisca vitripennis]
MCVDLTDGVGIDGLSVFRQGRSPRRHQPPALRRSVMWEQQRVKQGSEAAARNKGPIDRAGITRRNRRLIPFSGEMGLSIHEKLGCFLTHVNWLSYLDRSQNKHRQE